MPAYARNIIARLTIALLAVGLLWFSAFAQGSDSPQAGADPLISNLLVINSKPAPNGLVDYTVFYGNAGTATATNILITIDYDESKLYNLILGDPANCRDDGSNVICSYGSLDSTVTHTVGFDARVIPTTAEGTEIQTLVLIEADENVNEANDLANVRVTVTSVAAGGVISPKGITASELAGQIGALETPSGNQGVTIFNVEGNPEWRTDALTTAGLKFMIRGKEALGWSLSIEDAGFHNEAIRTSYLKVLTVVNSLFIIGLLAIAVMWMFSLFIPKRYLRQVVMVYGAAVIFVNFALPLNQLLIDTTNLLQKTFLTGVNISSIVETPNYNDKTAISYLNESGVIRSSASRQLNFRVTDEEGGLPTSFAIGTFKAETFRPSFDGIIRDESGVESDIVLTSLGNENVLRLNNDQVIELVDETTFNPNQEQSIFVFLMMFFTGLAYFGMALIFILRIVILWMLMILSPLLFLLAIFHATRSYFYNWIGIYARWLLIGPLLAVGISIMVGIWQTVGLPITSSYAGFGEFGILSNVGFYLPGREVANNLSTTTEMMEYLLFLVMLYVPIFFAFALTRQKSWSSAAMTIVEKHEARQAARLTATIAEVTEKKEETVTGAKAATGLVATIGSKLAEFTKPSGGGLPASMRTTEARTGPTIESAHAAHPEHLALSSMKDMMDLAAGEAKGSRNSGQRSIENLATAADNPDTGQRQKLMAVRNEIETRASQGDPEATRIMNEITTHETTLETQPTPGAEAAPLHAAAPEPGAPVTIKVEAEVKEKEHENVTPVTMAKAKPLEADEEELAEETAKEDESVEGKDLEADSLENETSERKSRKERAKEESEDDDLNNPFAGADL